MALDSTLKAWLALSQVPGLDGRSARSLLSAFGSPDAVVSATTSSLSSFVKPDVAAAIKAGVAGDSVDSTLAWLDLDGNHLLTLADGDYPQLLLNIPDPPLLLYVKGQPSLLTHPALAVVGSRNATPQGIENAAAFANALSDLGLCIVSGLALGVDAAAHRGALRGQGSTIAIAATGLDKVYPAANRELAHAIAQQGALVSEFPLGTPHVASNFPRRNRLISGMSLGCLVVEASLQSGALITARMAMEQGRDVFAIPGSIHRPQSRGSHALIKQGAKLVERAQDILEELVGVFPAPVNHGIKDAS
jgi:DNA processing protein